MKGALVDMFLNGSATRERGLSLIGLELALVSSALAGLPTVVPYFGPIAASILLILFGLGGLVRAGAAGRDRVRGRGTAGRGLPYAPAGAMSQTRVGTWRCIALGWVVCLAAARRASGLFVAVPVLSLIVVLVDELWVKPRQAAALSWSLNRIQAKRAASVTVRRRAAKET